MKISELPWVKALSGNQVEDITLGKVYRFYVHPDFPDKNYVNNNFKLVKPYALYGYNIVRLKVRNVYNSDDSFICYASNLFDWIINQTSALARF